MYYGFTGLTLFPIYLYFAIKFGGVYHFKSGTLGWAYLSALSASSAGIIYLYLLSRNPTNWVTAFTASYPIITLLIGVIFLKEVLTPNAIMGTVIIIVGLFILNL